MASRRMFSKDITDTDKFLDMPASARCLYFHLGMSADDDGFVSNPRSVSRLSGASDDDMRLLIAKGYVIPFETSVIVITHWMVNNNIRKDTYKPTRCIQEKSMLCVGSDGSYKHRTEPVTDTVRTRYEVGTGSDTQYSIGKYSIDKDREDYHLPKADNVCAYASSNLTCLTPTHMDELNGFVDDLSEEIVKHAIDNACAAGVRKWSFAKAILNAYIESGVKTLGDALESDKKHKANKTTGGGSKPKFDYEQRQYSKEDFGADFFYDPLKME